MNRIDGTAEDWNSLARSVVVVECELNSDCNRSCSYCPQSIDLLPRTPQQMSDDVFEWMLDDLARIDFHGRFSHHLYGEPLLNPRLDERVRRIRQRLPKAIQVMFSNGDLLTDELHGSLLEAGIDFFAITRHERGPYAERPHQAVQYARELVFTSRGGTIDFLLKKKRNSLAAIRQRPCHAPDEMLIVGWNGHLLRCYEDARRESPLGDLRVETLAAIWARTAPMREALQRGDRAAAGSPCGTCDNINHTTTGCSVATEPFWQTHPDAVAIAARAGFV
jgi:radical SAM protein with 4Fe4S-binding SPASM domain